ncbi:hypothetical protein SKAU_G00343240 [Synaphobranchus kaupii]|uniref:Uncharacterized protein n=1 Tax=Synaphobranchus kaupii TaxID=118154 RepID=A0A9Q1IHF7_SYNKA|nr:hypothetical protein SKAU_G00343240 [Synaphobranchus kaupii]
MKTPTVVDAVVRWTGKHLDYGSECVDSPPQDATVSAGAQSGSARRCVSVVGETRVGEHYWDSERTIHSLQNIHG